MAAKIKKQKIKLMFSFLVSYDIELNLGKDIGVFHEISKRFLLAGSFTFPTFLGPHFGGFFLLGFKKRTLRRSILSPASPVSARVWLKVFHEQLREAWQSLLPNQLEQSIQNP